jgi:sugar/nucleoside kinase (ribokinase family)
MGNRGSCGITHKEHIKAAAYTNEQCVDSIGAGDSFNSGFIQAFLEGLPLQECLSQGNLMGAISTSAAGGTGAFQNQQEFEKTKKRIIDSSLRK